MIVFGVDSSAAAGSAAAVRDGEVLYEAFANEGLTHSETLLVRCDEVFRGTGIEPAQVDCFAVTAGPGSFTGLRIGLGLVKGMAFVRNTPSCMCSGCAPETCLLLRLSCRGGKTCPRDGTGDSSPVRTGTTS